MKILITGGGGQLATELCLAASKMNVNVVALTKSQLDICDIKAVSIILHQEQPAWVINTAAYTAVDKAETDAEQAFAINAKGVENLAIVCKKFDIPLLHISTDYVFSGKQARPYQEDDICEPINIYGQSKLAGELILQAIWDKYIILRTAWLYGNFGRNFMQTMLQLAKKNKKISIVADQKGNPTATLDLANTILIIILAKTQQWGIYHWTNHGVTSWYEFAKAIFELQPNDFPKPTLIPITSTEYPTAAKRPYYSVLDCTKLKKNYGIEPRAWQQALHAVVTQERT